MARAVPNPPVRAAGSRLTAGIYGSDVTDDIQFLANVPTFKGYQSAAQSIADSTLTAIAINAELIDSDNGHDNATNNSRYTCQSTFPGWYLVGVSVGLAANATGDRVIEIHKNGVIDRLAQFNMRAPTAGVAVVHESWMLVQLAVGDYVEGFYFQTSGGAQNTVPDQTGMTVIWIRA